MSADIRALGESIRAARMRKGLTQEALAEQIGTTRQAVSNGRMIRVSRKRRSCCSCPMCLKCQ